MKGPVPDWLPHLMAPKQIPSFNAQADDIYHLQMSSIFKNSPFGVSLTSDEDDNWNVFYKSLCNPVARQNRIPFKNKVEIVLRMCYKEKRVRHYTYQPDHVINNKQCMIMQTKHFLLHEGTTQEIDISKHNELCSEHTENLTIAHEIAFGPMADISEHNHGVYFDVENIKPLPKIWKSRESDNDIGFLPEAPFFITETLDDNAHQLMKDVLRFYVSNNTKAAYASLKNRFQSIMLHYSTLSWPRNANGYGSSNVAEVNAFYDFDSCNQNNLKTKKIWESFIDTIKNVSVKFYFILWFTNNINMIIF